MNEIMADIAASPAYFLLGYVTARLVQHFDETRHRRNR